MLELELMELIYQGIDPRTGETFKPWRDPVLDKRRAAYLESLRKVQRQSVSQRLPGDLPVLSERAQRMPNQGARWYEEEDQRLRTCWASPERPSIEQVAEQFGRNAGGIRARLVKLGLFPNTDAVQAENRLRQPVQR